MADRRPGADGRSRSVLRQAARFLPAPLRRALRSFVRELPIRLSDAPADFREALGRSARPLPPARLRRRVGGNSRRSEFLFVGRRVSEDMRAALGRVGRIGDTGQSWLDFGCGSGRIARHVSEWPFVRDFHGVDVDAGALGWSRRHLRGAYETIRHSPPTSLPSGRFDVVYAISVFTHFDESAQERWLTELHRVLKPGGLLVASTSSPSLSWERRDMTESQRETLARDGFFFLPGGGADFNEETAYHSNEYLLRAWGRHFGQRLFLAHGAAGYQDLSVWEKW